MSGKNHKKKRRVLVALPPGTQLPPPGAVAYLLPIAPELATRLEALSERIKNAGVESSLDRVGNWLLRCAVGDVEAGDLEEAIRAFSPHGAKDSPN